ncbi:MAG: succinate dehydrogenase, hydrophobic membrane anchor protein [Sphingobium sp.]|nr:succinate dehydrogenase, hydrophobic membrane anchor protein [Sphingobium sp.]MBP6112843.1 succinate dehydrogenase, hydrophobic membrane anchor protein [Sphingobium sp.]MBP8670788.1 succinate dehydrogenase, hydrophobic membrane anchor protein [Sphingobium sp.]MBP9157738.1 succinate dehydrogenase, hydrophobic membrane anchor protein [Sphingobium sp.]MCC6481031.1 succinate dehydrogenase, hydrophobic membrane anchor protein [Sphingomonadaceae bacterium]
MGNGTSIGRVRGLGSAKSGPHHWILQRFTAVSNMALVLWLIFSLLHMPGLDYDSVVGWLRQPLVAVPMALMLVSVFWHLKLGLQVVIEDYVHDDGLKFFVIMLLNFYAIGGAALGLFAIAKIAFTGGAAA